jgi:hypothetical protein
MIWRFGRETASEGAQRRPAARGGNGFLPKQSHRELQKCFDIKDLSRLARKTTKPNEPSESQAKPGLRSGADERDPTRMKTAKTKPPNSP